MSKTQRMPIWWAITVGLVWVNLPIIPLMLAPMYAWLLGLVFLLPEGSRWSGRLDPDAGLFGVAIVFGALVIGLVLAWSWWSWNVPKWRLWAYQRVDDIEKLKKAAVAVGIIWRDGHVFEKTEIRSEETDQVIRDLGDNEK